MTTGTDEEGRNVRTVVTEYVDSEGQSVFDKTMEYTQTSSRDDEESNENVSLVEGEDEMDPEMSEKSKVVVETDTGARISRWLSPSVGYCSTSDFRLHFGLGESASIKNIIVTWPGKILQRYAGVEVDQFITLSRGSTEITLN